MCSYIHYVNIVLSQQESLLLHLRTWLKAVATISHVLKLNMATIQRWPLFEDGVYYTEAPNVWLLFNNYNMIELTNK